MPEPQIAFTEILGQVIRRKRQGKEITQETIAPRLALTASALSRIESGHTPLTVVNLLRIATSLGVRGSDLLREAEDVALRIPSASPGVRVVEERPKSMEETTGWFLGGAAVGALLATVLSASPTERGAKARAPRNRK